MIFLAIIPIQITYGQQYSFDVENENISNNTEVIINVNLPSENKSLFDTLIDNGIITAFSIIGVGIPAIVTWYRRRGIPPFNEQERIVKELITSRLEEQLELAWTQMFFETQEDNQKLDEYWESLKQGSISGSIYLSLFNNAVQYANDLSDDRHLKDYFANESMTIKQLVDVLFVQVIKKYHKSVTDEIVGKIVKFSVDYAYEENETLRYILDDDTLLQLPTKWRDEAFIYLKPLIVINKLLITQGNLEMLIKLEIKKSISENPPIDLR